MEICPKCHQLMTWYMTYNSGNPYCGYHCNNCGYDTMNNTHTVTTSKTISINNQPKPIIQEVVQVSDDSINKIADAVVRKLTDRKTENSSEIPNNCETCKHNKLEWYSEACDGCSKAHSNYEPKDEPQIYGNEHNCIMTLFGDCSYAETGCGSCEVVEKVRKALDKYESKTEPQTEREGER